MTGPRKQLPDTVTPTFAETNSSIRPAAVGPTLIVLVPGVFSSGFPLVESKYLVPPTKHLKTPKKPEHLEPKVLGYLEQSICFMVKVLINR